MCSNAIILMCHYIPMSVFQHGNAYVANESIIIGGFAYHTVTSSPGVTLSTRSSSSVNHIDDGIVPTPSLLKGS